MSGSTPRTGQRRPVSEMLAHLTGGRRYCFVIMGFHTGFSFFERIRRIVTEVTGLECIRADDIPTSDRIRDKVHACIDGAALVMANVTDPTANIYYEIGYATASRKPMIAIAEAKAKIPADLEGIEAVRYDDSKDGLILFETHLKHHLAVHADSNISLLRAMIIPPEPSPSFILASPKLPRPRSRFPFHPKERRTYGDNLAIVGILGAFASAFSDHCVPELLSAMHAPEDVLNWDANLFLVGSPKVNTHTRLFLERLQKDSSAPWQLEKCPLDQATKDHEFLLTGLLDGAPFRSACVHRDAPESEQMSDYGLIVRGPHPTYPSRLVTIIAGPHSLGTAAAALAATRSGLMREISRRLVSSGGPVPWDRTFWALVRGTADFEGHITPDLVEIVAAGLCGEDAAQ